MAEPIKIATSFGPYLIGRGIGKEIREAHFSGEPSEWPPLDFTGVVQATESALDEIFGTLARLKGPESVLGIQIIGASVQIKDALEYVFSLIKSPPPTLTAEGIRRVLGRRGKRKPRRKAQAR